MEENKILEEQAVEEVVGGGSDWRGAHWQDTRHQMGTEFWENGRHWYRIKFGDTLHDIANKFGVTMADLQRWNPKTITNIQKIYAGDTIVVGF